MLSGDGIGAGRQFHPKLPYEISLEGRLSRIRAGDREAEGSLNEKRGVGSDNE